LYRRKKAVNKKLRKGKIICADFGDKKIFLQSENFENFVSAGTGQCVHLVDLYNFRTGDFIEALMNIGHCSFISPIISY